MKSLYLFTAQYPYSRIENFLEDEIHFHLERFDKVYVIPSDGDRECERQVPDGCIVYNPLSISSNKFAYLLKGFFSFKTIHLFANDFFRSKVYQSKKKIKLWRTAVLSLNNYLHNKTLKEIAKNLTPDDVCYFYWGTGINKISIIWRGKAHFVSRFHGEWDLWEESSDNYAPLRQEIAGALDKAVLISRKGESYFKKHYSNCPTAFYPLGSQDYGVGPVGKDDNVLRVISCSTVYPLKRVPLIFESLNISRFAKIEWTHIGGGPHFEELKAKVEAEKNDHLTVNLLGSMIHDEVMEYYKCHRFDVFVNLSTNEGVPVSIMEAISFDIPVIATNVGGTSDVVPKEVGELVSANPTIMEVSTALCKVKESSYLPREFWHTHYNAEVNYTAFAEMLKGL
jgi:colanic acid/amylovoran biosynthesis glycosyltransferase